MRRLSVKLPDSLFAALEKRAEEDHRDLSNMVRRILSLELGAPETEELDETVNPELPLS